MGEKIIYCIKIKIDLTAEEDWLEWMKEIYIPQLVITGFFNDAKIYKEIKEEKAGNLASYEIHCRTNDLNNFVKYTENSAAAMQKLLSERYGGKYIAERALLIEN